MDVKLFETLAKYAGLAGISLGFVLVIFRAILKKNLPDPHAAYSLLKQVMYLTFIIGIVGIAAWFFSSKVNHKITGHVLEKDSRNSIQGAEVTLSGHPESATTDDHGNFYLTLVDDPPTQPTPLYVSKTGYKVYEVGVIMGQNIEVELLPAVPLTASAKPTDPNTSHEATPSTDFRKIQVTTEVYQSDQVASGACKDFGAWATLCSSDKPNGWTIAEQHFQLTGDRAGCAYAECTPLSITETKACYRFRTQGHDEECGHSGNTGIHYSQGILTVTWKHP